MGLIGLGFSVVGYGLANLDRFAVGFGGVNSGIEVLAVGIAFSVLGGILVAAKSRTLSSR